MGFGRPRRLCGFQGDDEIRFIAVRSEPSVEAHVPALAVPRGGREVGGPFIMILRARLGQLPVSQCPADHEEIRPVGRATLAGKGRRQARLGGLGLSSLRVSPRPGTGRCQCGLRLGRGIQWQAHLALCGKAAGQLGLVRVIVAPEESNPELQGRTSGKQCCSSNFIQTT